MSCVDAPLQAPDEQDDDQALARHRHDQLPEAPRAPRSVALQRTIIAAASSSVSDASKSPDGGVFHETASPSAALVLHRSMVYARLPGITFTARPTLPGERA